MNIRYSLLALCMLLFGLQACDKDDDPPADDREIVCLPGSLSANVIAFYPFSNGSLKDFSGNNMQLANNTGAKPAADRFGNPDCAFEFDNHPNAADSLVAANTQVLNGLTTFSVALWYQPMDTSAQTPVKVEDMVAYDKWNINLFDCRKPNFAYWENSTKTGWSVWDTNMVAIGTPDVCHMEVLKRTDIWHHLVVTFDKAGNKVKIYRDGILRDEDASFTQAGNFMPYQPIMLILGGHFTGRMDDVAIFNKALSQAEIDMVYQSPPCCSN